MVAPSLAIAQPTNPTKGFEAPTAVKEAVPVGTVTEVEGNAIFIPTPERISKLYLDYRSEFRVSNPKGRPLTEKLFTRQLINQVNVATDRAFPGGLAPGSKWTIEVEVSCCPWRVRIRGTYNS
jgi:hypothetical protein